MFNNIFQKLVLLALVIACIVFPGTVWAENSFVITPDKLIEADKNNSSSFENFAGYAIPSAMMSSVIVATRGTPQQVGTSSNGQPLYSYEGGVTNYLVKINDYFLSTKPASSINYLADIGNNLGLIKPAYAQGLGFTAISPLLTLWKVFRDIAYVLLIIVSVFVSLMIMFRKKIDPRTVVTVQDAIPKIIVTLILITFSYALAGLIIDISDLLTKLVGNTLMNSKIIAVSGSSEVLRNLYQANIFQLVNPIRDTASFTNAIQGAGAGGIKLPVLGDISLEFIFQIASLFVMVKIFFSLLTPYASIVLSIIFAPLILLGGALPGSQNNLASWLKSFLSKILVFPAVFGMLAIAAAIKGNLATNSVWGGVADWNVVPTTVRIMWYPATIGNFSNAIGHLVSFGILFMIPNIPEIIQQLFQIKAQPWESGAVGSQELKSAVGRLPVIGGMLQGAIK